MPIVSAFSIANGVEVLIANDVEVLKPTTTPVSEPSFTSLAEKESIDSCLRNSGQICPAVAWVANLVPTAFRSRPR